MPLHKCVLEMISDELLIKDSIIVSSEEDWPVADVEGEEKKRKKNFTDKLKLKVKIKKINNFRLLAAVEQL